MIVIGVSYRKINKKLGKRAKRYPFLYYYDEGSGKFNARRINKIQAFWYKLHKKRRLGMFVQRVTVLLKAINQKKKI